MVRSLRKAFIAGMRALLPCAPGPESRKLPAIVGSDGGCAIGGADGVEAQSQRSQPLTAGALLTAG